MRQVNVLYIVERIVLVAVIALGVMFVVLVVSNCE